MQEVCQKIFFKKGLTGHLLYVIIYIEKRKEVNKMNIFSYKWFDMAKGPCKRGIRVEAENPKEAYEKVCIELTRRGYDVKKLLFSWHYVK